MKYIRTKENVYLVHHEDNAFYFIWVEIEKAYTLIPKEEIITQADTIEELCDFCEIDYTDNIYEIYDLTQEEYPKGFIENHIDDGLIISVFVGLKTNKGLIYVAKMKGVLPNGEIDWELL